MSCMTENISRYVYVVSVMSDKVCSTNNAAVFKDRIMDRDFLV